MLIRLNKIVNFLLHIAFKIKKSVPLCLFKNDSVAQLVEQLTLNQWVEGSSPPGGSLHYQALTE